MSKPIDVRNEESVKAQKERDQLLARAKEQARSRSEQKLKEVLRLEIKRRGLVLLKMYEQFNTEDGNYDEMRRALTAIDYGDLSDLVPSSQSKNIITYAAALDLAGDTSSLTDLRSILKKLGEITYSTCDNREFNTFDAEYKKLHGGRSHEGVVGSLQKFLQELNGAKAITAEDIKLVMEASKQIGVSFIIGAAISKNNEVAESGGTTSVTRELQALVQEALYRVNVLEHDSSSEDYADVLFARADKEAERSVPSVDDLIIKSRRAQATSVVTQMKTLWQDDISVFSGSLNPLKNLKNVKLLEENNQHSIDIPLDLGEYSSDEEMREKAEEMQALLSGYFGTDVRVERGVRANDGSFDVDKKKKVTIGSRYEYRLVMPIDHVVKSVTDVGSFFINAKAQRKKVLSELKNPKDFIGRTTAGMFALATPVIVPLAVASRIAGLVCAHFPVLSQVFSPVASVCNAFAQTLLESSAVIFKAVGVEGASKWAKDLATDIKDKELSRLRPSSGYGRTFPRLLQELTSGVSSIVSVVCNAAGAPVHMMADKAIKFARSSNPVIGLLPGIFGAGLKIVAATITTTGKFFSNIAENYQRSNKSGEFTWQSRLSKFGRGLVEKSEAKIKESSNVKLNFVDKEKAGVEFQLSGVKETKDAFLARVESVTIDTARKVEQLIVGAAQFIPLDPENVGVVMNLTGDTKFRGNRPYMQLAQFEIGYGDDAREVKVLLGQDGKAVVVAAKAVDGKNEVIAMSPDEMGQFGHKLFQIVSGEAARGEKAVVPPTLDEIRELSDEELFKKLQVLSKKSSPEGSSEGPKIMGGSGKKVAVYALQGNNKLYVPIADSGKALDANRKIKIGMDTDNLRDFVKSGDRINSDVIKLVSAVVVGAKHIEAEERKSAEEQQSEEEHGSPGTDVEGAQAGQLSSQEELEVWH